MSLFSTSHRPSSRHPQDPFMHRIANDPYLDWLILIIIAVILSGIVIGTGLIRYQEVQDRISAPVVLSALSPNRLLDGESMSRIIKAFSARATEHAALLKGYTGVADPSL